MGERRTMTIGMSGQSEVQQMHALHRWSTVRDAVIRRAEATPPQSVYLTFRGPKGGELVTLYLTDDDFIALGLLLTAWDEPEPEIVSLYAAELASGEVLERAEASDARAAAIVRALT